MDINQLSRLGITSQLPWVDHPYYMNGQLHRVQVPHNQYQRTTGWASQVVGAPGVTALPASNLGGADPVSTYDMMPSRLHQFSAPGFAPGYGPDRRKKKKKKGSFNPLAEITQPDFSKISDDIKYDTGNIENTFQTDLNRLSERQQRKMDTSLADMQDAQDSAYAAPHMQSAEFRAGAKAETAAMDQWEFTRQRNPEYTQEDISMDIPDEKAPEPEKREAPVEVGKHKLFEWGDDDYR